MELGEAERERHRGKEAYRRHRDGMDLASVGREVGRVRGVGDDNKVGGGNNDVWNPLIIESSV